ncbi:MAG: hypothetical protein IJS14_14085 [Lentisphaeria bacterium]|nr:hypothetical protein [Lentisphaeria bacterium]
MGTIFIIACGLIGACSAGRQSFFACWLFLVNFCFALYAAIFLAPLAIPLLEIPGLTPEIKNLISVGLICVVAFFILKKISESVFPGSGDSIPLPTLPAKLGAILSNGLAGVLVGGLVVYLFVQLPFFGMLPGPMQDNLQKSGRKVLCGMIGTVNAFSFQSVTPAGIEDLRTLGLMPKPEPPAGSKQEGKTAGADGKTAPSDKKP